MPVRFTAQTLKGETVELELPTRLESYIAGLMEELRQARSRKDARHIKEIEKELASARAQLPKTQERAVPKDDLEHA
jgi:hypothetical protein